MTDRSVNSLASNSNTKIFGSNVRSVHASNQYANYSFIAVLSFVQKLRIRFFFITWQTALNRVEKNDQIEINQALINIQINFAFKFFQRSQQHFFKKIVQELMALSHSVMRKHEHIITLKRIC